LALTSASAAALPSLSGSPPPPADRLSAFRAAVAALRPEELIEAWRILDEASPRCD
jgi:hypothetical protein